MRPIYRVEMVLVYALDLRPHQALLWNLYMLRLNWAHGVVQCTCSGNVLNSGCQGRGAGKTPGTQFLLCNCQDKNETHHRVISQTFCTMPMSMWNRAYVYVTDCTSQYASSKGASKLLMPSKAISCLRPRRPCCSYRSVLAPKSFIPPSRGCPTPVRASQNQPIYIVRDTIITRSYAPANSKKYLPSRVRGPNPGFRPSYSPSATGDFRMYFGENPDKVKNIVSATQGEFQDLYAPSLKVQKLLRCVFTSKSCSLLACPFTL